MDRAVPVPGAIQTFTEALVGLGHLPLAQQDFGFARQAGRAILTYNARDFWRMQEHTPNHPGILAVYQDNDPRRDTDHFEIVQAIANLERTGVVLAGGFWVLNASRWPAS